MRKLKEFYEDFFDCPPESNEARDLGKETGQKLQERLNTLQELKRNESLYPFLSELSEPITLLKEVTGKQYAYYLEGLLTQRDRLLDLKDTIIAPILSFWNGPQKTMYDEARQFLQGQSANFDYLDGDEAARLKEALSDKDVFQGSRMQQVRVLVESMRSKVTERVRQEKEEAVKAIRALQERVAAMDEVTALTPDQRKHALGDFDIRIRQIEEQSLIPVIREKRRWFEEHEYMSILSMIAGWTVKEPPKPEPGKTGEEHVCKEPKIEYVSRRSIQVDFDKPWLADEEDIEPYLDALRAALIKEIARERRIKLST